MIESNSTMPTYMRLIGGVDAHQNDVPFQVHLNYNERFICGGSIISAWVILTAAHCLLNKCSQNLKVVAGDYDRNKQEGTEQTRYVSRMIIHDDFNLDKSHNDIALLILSTPLEFNNQVHSINYPKRKQIFSGTGIISGWGRNEKAPESSALRKAQVPLVLKYDCQRRYRLNNIEIVDGMLCAGGYGKDACEGDSGGPLTCLGQHGETTLCGVVSFGTSCGVGGQGNPGVYTDVSYYSNWISKSLADDKAATCGKNQFRCTSSGKCIDIKSRCDGDSDCADNSDEEHCDRLCKDTDFKCNSGKCIPQEWKCDGDRDCDDGEDEPRFRCLFRLKF